MASITSFYKGFSTRNYEENGSTFELHNVACIQEDLMNEIFTTRGERLYMPTYGTRIPTLVFEQNDAQTMDVIREDIINVINNDPRVILQDLAVEQIPDSYSIFVVAKITYLAFDVTSDLLITVTSR